MDNLTDKFFNNDPVYMKSLIGKKVQIKTIENIVHSGVVYVIDPIYKTVVLNTNQRVDDLHNAIFVLYHAIESLQVLSEEVDEEYLKSVSRSEPDIPINSNNEKKIRLKKWLQHMYIDVSESGDYLKIDNHLLIVPPYGTENCISSNTIILDRIQKIIIGLMPPDFNSDTCK